MAEADPDGHTADHFADLLMERAEFDGERAIINQELAAQLPCPFPRDDTL
jgi:hypothetical protein